MDPNRPTITISSQEHEARIARSKKVARYGQAVTSLMELPGREKGALALGALGLAATVAATVSMGMGLFNMIGTDHLDNVAQLQNQAKTAFAVAAVSGVGAVGLRKQTGHFVQRMASSLGLSR